MSQVKKKKACQDMNNLREHRKLLAVEKSGFLLLFF
jgi:hypothetical protein